jgi:hypothetical protein
MRIVVAAGLGLTLLACGGERQQEPPTVTVEALPSPAGLHSGEPFLTTDASGAVHMTWIERTSDSTHAVRYARLHGADWTAPSTIVERGDLFVNWADYPAVIAAPSGRLVAHWLQRSGSGRYAYEVRVAQSSDGGASWSDGMVLHTDRSPGEHGFVAMWVAAGDSVRAAWLDGRHMGGGHGAEGADGAMSVQSVALAADGTLGVESALDLRSCECCQVAATVASSGPVIAYRDRSEREVRDIVVVRHADGRWTEPVLVYDDGWEISACPVNGPALAARGDTVAIAWFTGAKDTARVRVAFSVDGGARFATPVQIDGGAPAGRVGISLDEHGAAIVSWLERVPPEAAEVRVRRVTRTGEMSAPITVSRTKAARASGFPRIVRRGPELIAAWTVPGDSAQVKLARIPLAGFR